MLACNELPELFSFRDPPLDAWPEDMRDITLDALVELVESRKPSDATAALYTRFAAYQLPAQAIIFYDLQDKWKEIRDRKNAQKTPPQQPGGVVTGV